MKAPIVMLSGAVAVGKSTLATALRNRYGFFYVSTRALLRAFVGDEVMGRKDLQAAGDELDRNTNGEWIVSGLNNTDVADALISDRPLLIDCIRTTAQAAHIRRFGGNRVVHVHLHAALETTEERYKDRGGGDDYSDVRAGETNDLLDGSLRNIADICINTDRCSPEDIAVRVACALGFYNHNDRLVDVLVGGQWGSEGKGQVSGYLAREYQVLVRVGGPNAGHKVFERPKPYTFYHLPSGTRANQEAIVVLGPAAVLGLPKLMEEIHDCNLQRSGRLFIDPQAMVIESSDIELENGPKGTVAGIGGTGQGVGAATARKALRSAAESTLGAPVRLARDVPELRQFIKPTLEVLDLAYAGKKKIFLEGTQGTLLSLHHGAYPWVTSRDTTVAGTMSDAGIAPSRLRRSIMVCRSYPIRVKSVENTSGPMGREINFQEVGSRSGLDGNELVQLEKTTTTKRDRRVAEFNWTEYRRAVTLNGPTDIALTFADYFGKENAEARRYDQLNAGAQRQCEEMERVAGAPVSLIATRFHFRAIVDRRSW